MEEIIVIIYGRSRPSCKTAFVITVTTTVGSLHINPPPPGHRNLTGTPHILVGGRQYAVTSSYHCLLLSVYDQPRLPDGSVALLLLRCEGLLVRTFVPLHFHPHAANDKNENIRSKERVDRKTPWYVCYISVSKSSLYRTC